MGGMASVHRAEVDGIEGFSKSIALKRMLPSVAANAELVQAFVREAQLTSHLRHTNVPQTYELGKVGDIYFIAMELVTGRTLRDILQHCARTTGPMPVQIALNILNQVCDALDYAHNLCDDSGRHLGIIHRDVSPSNVIVGETGVAKLIDFGIAKAAGQLQTRSGTIKGKFGYVAPEYTEGRIDARADLFAIGVMAHELLTNRPLFSTNDDYETLKRVREMPIVPPSQLNAHVPPDIDGIVMTALERDPQQRWQHATALRSALTTLTRRLGLVASDADVVAWLDWLYAQTGDVAHDGVHDGASMSIHIEQGTNVHAGLSIPVRPSQLQSVPTLMISGAPPVVAQPPPFAVPSGQFDDAVPTLVRPTAPRVIAADAMQRSTPSLARASDEQLATPPPNRQSPIALTPPVRSSGRLDERTGIMRAQLPLDDRPSQSIAAVHAPLTPVPQHRPSQALPTSFSQRPSQAFQAPSAPPMAGPRVLPMAPSRGPGVALVVIMVLVIAGIVGTVVYFLLPRVLE